MALFMELNIQMDSLCPLPGLFWEGTDKHSHPGVGSSSPVPPLPQGEDNGRISCPLQIPPKAPATPGAEAQSLGYAQSSSVCSPETQKPVIMNTRQKPIKQNKHKSKWPQSHSVLTGKSGASPVPPFPQWLIPWYKSSGRCPLVKAALTSPLLPGRGAAAHAPRASSQHLATPEPHSHPRPLTSL